MSHLLILSRDFQEYQELLQTKLPDTLSITATDNIESVSAMQQEFTIALATPALIAPHLEKLTKLSWLQSTFAGIDSLIQPGLRQDYQLTNVRGVFGPLMSEYVMGHLLAITRHHDHYTQAQKHKRWDSKPYSSLAGQNILILGTGSIGSYLANTLGRFGLSVTGISKSGRQKTDFDNVYPLTQLHDILPRADIIVSALPDTPESQDIFSSASFALFKPNAIFFNLGRGSAVNEEDLCKALQAGLFQHAVLDVFKQEPLPKASPLWNTPRLTITPHNSAYSFPTQVADIFLENHAHWSRQEALTNLVDFSKGY